MSPFQELRVKRLSTCDLVSDSDKLRMFREIRAREWPNDWRCWIEFRARTGFGISTYVLLVRDVNNRPSK
jgi:hypothetical protein